MDLVSIAVLLALPAAPLPERAPLDLDSPARESLVQLDSPYMKSQVLAAMAMPYKYGVSQLPCRAKALQPARGWQPVREPAGKIEWIPGPATKVFWSGIYGTCLIQSPLAREKVNEAQRISLECECNGWLPSNP
jgi:hypothetical protein